MSNNEQAPVKELRAGKKLTQAQVTKKKIHFLPILDFIAKGESSFTVEAIAYHMKHGKIDWMQPARDKFVLITPHNLEFYSQCDPMFFKKENF